MEIKTSLIFLLLLSNSTLGQEKKGEKKIVCFHSGLGSDSSVSEIFSPHDIVLDSCTHIVYAYANLDSYDRIIAKDIYSGSYFKTSSFKSQNKNLQRILGVGKGLSSKMSAIAGDKERRLRFARSALMFLRINQLSGINLSWQHPGSHWGGAQDKTNYVLLLKALREEFERESVRTGRSSLLISIDVPHHNDLLNDGFDIPSLTKYLDFMNVFAFDYRFFVEADMSQQAPFYSIINWTDPSYESQVNVNFTIKNYLGFGVEREKIVLGIPAFGHTLVIKEAETSHLEMPEREFERNENLVKLEGTLPYYEICNMMKTESWEVQNSSSTMAGLHVQRQGSLLVGYDDPDSVRLKAQFAAQEGLGGIMFYTIDFDDFKGDCHGKRFPLLQAGREAFLDLHKHSITTNSLLIKKEEPQHSANSLRDSILKTSGTATETQDQKRLFIRTAVQTESTNEDNVFPKEETVTSTNGLTLNLERLSIEGQLILQQLIALVKKVGGVAVLEKLLTNSARDLEESSSPDSIDVRSYQTESHGPEVTSLLVTSPPLILETPRTPIVFSNFTINIGELNIDTRSFSET